MNAKVLLLLFVVVAVVVAITEIMQMVYAYTTFRKGGGEVFSAKRWDHRSN